MKMITKKAILIVGILFGLILMGILGYRMFRGDPLMAQSTIAWSMRDTSIVIYHGGVVERYVNDTLKSISLSDVSNLKQLIDEVTVEDIDFRQIETNCPTEGATVVYTVYPSNRDNWSATSFCGPSGGTAFNRDHDLFSAFSEAIE